MDLNQNWDPFGVEGSVLALDSARLLGDNPVVGPWLGEGVEC